MPVQTGPGAHPASCTMGTRSFPEVKSGQGVTLTSHPILGPWSRNISVIPLLPVWAIHPVQSISACTRVDFTFTFYLINLSKNCKGTNLMKISFSTEHLTCANTESHTITVNSIPTNKDHMVKQIQCGQACPSSYSSYPTT